LWSHPLAENTFDSFPRMWQRSIFIISDDVCFRFNPSNILLRIMSIIGEEIHGH
jgi:hypothetical protein